MNAQTKVEPSILGALAKALPELEGAKKNKANPAFKSKYADLGSIIDALEPLRPHGIWFRQVQHDNEAGVLIETFYIHESGQELSAGQTFVPAVKKDAQGYGSAMSYARRYGLQSAFGLATEDDDGNAASASVRNRPTNAGQGRSQESAVSPDQHAESDTQSGIPKGTKLAGPHTSKTALWKAVKEFDRELRSCSDVDMLDALIGTKDAQELLAQLERDAPNVARTGDGLPAEFEPIIPLMAKLRSDLLANENEPWAPSAINAG